MFICQSNLTKARTVAEQLAVKFKKPYYVISASNGLNVESQKPADEMILVCTADPEILLKRRFRYLSKTRTLQVYLEEFPEVLPSLDDIMTLHEGDSIALLPRSAVKAYQFTRVT
jgi:hypothetical protein